MSTERLVTEEADGSLPSETEIFAALYPRLRRLAAVVSPVEVDPDDLVQDALERTIRRGPLTSLDNPQAYLSRVIVNLASNQRRGLARARLALARLRPEDGIDPVYPSDASELLRLPPRQRAVLFLSIVEGFTHAEIADQLDMTEAAVSKTSQRARRQLSTELKEELR